MIYEIIIFRFSPIENMFGHIKRELRDLEIKGDSKLKPAKLAKAILDVCFHLKKHQVEGFFRKTFLNMIDFWFKLDRNHLLNEIA